MSAALLSVVLALPIFVVHGFYRAIFRYSGWPALMTVAKAMLVYGLLFFTFITAFGLEGVPRTLGLIQPMLLLLAVGLSRALARYWLGGAYHNRLRLAALPKVLVYGAGDAGRQLVRGMANSHEMRVVGFLDDDDRLHGHVLNGQAIFNPKDLGELVLNLGVTHVLLALPTISRSRRNEILNTLAPFKVSVRTLPSLNDLAQGKVNVSDLRELDIDDLLGREPVQPNGLLLNLNTHRKRVLVTGAGGSIGSELCRQILKTNPKQLLLVEMSEFALYQIHQELQAALAGDRMSVNEPVEGDAPEAADASDGPDIEIVPLLASVCDEVRMHEIMDTWKPHTVYHAAAYKHVPLVEHNPAEGVRNNVWGTRVCAEAAQRNGVRNFVLISTDKAVRPTNIMGASKRLAEMVLQALADGSPRFARDDTFRSTRDDTFKITRDETFKITRDDESNVTANLTFVTASAAKRSITTFSMVRFGNVLGSSGSVVPLFREQIKNGGPITLTHAGITRYFMTIPEAAQLVIQAGAMGQGGGVFVLDMGQPVKIIELARRMVELSGLTVRDELHPDGDIELTVTGLRPGEKLYEELLIGDNPKPTQHPRIMKAHEQFLPWPQLVSKLDALSLAMSVNDVPVIRGLLQQLVSGYQPSGEVVDWVHLAQEREALANE
ncbi:polysaccharide biosynthesis protein [Limnohabitans sp.]|jgi:FlaA1/EpsC-like NDP-sugar epimerase|uniref:polysaccharide biosynthesis protein n=1 Tax=Limnohabitans sp. TaxID=1907725 RepID=UPI0037BFDFA4